MLCIPRDTLVHCWWEALMLLVVDCHRDFLWRKVKKGRTGRFCSTEGLLKRTALELHVTTLTCCMLYNTIQLEFSRCHRNFLERSGSWARQDLNSPSSDYLLLTIASSCNHRYYGRVSCVLETTWFSTRAPLLMLFYCEFSSPPPLPFPSYPFLFFFFFLWGSVQGPSPLNRLL